ncbi:RNA polymerase subunit sigma-70 [Amycolatopsis cynarae]|uniref:RNA polymerase subunit sigma-70 n=1 Tax=Amycolatopsis cynarae TaxID=2995223 RepID=A0ABY7AVK8_9PSEU|nr:RNA polymerase subunit sigma-70 [Amycolatopsis sp. HUAS 11-8]WAL63528.1 RNA polymerase subunit sigma-70 [Amycolatopsis sp. HUAS 11-8]
MSDFAGRTERYRRELHVHCYRMLASFDDAEDAVQETMLRAWRGRSGFSGTRLRAWLYRIATNVCLDVLRDRSRHPAHSFPEMPWLQPYPDRLLDEPSDGGDRPDTAAVSRETIELTFLTATQALPARQRAAFLARDVLGFSAAETAELLGTSVAAANSALQRARTTLRERLPARRADWVSPGPSEAEREVLTRFIEAHERGDAEAAVAISAPGLRIAMPPRPEVFTGARALIPLLGRAVAEGEWRLVPSAANRMPTAASYLRRPGDGRFRAFKFDVLQVEGGLISEITTFGAELFPAFGLPLFL